ICGNKIVYHSQPRAAREPSLRTHVPSSTIASILAARMRRNGAGKNAYRLCTAFNRGSDARPSTRRVEGGGLRENVPDHWGGRAQCQANRIDLLLILGRAQIKRGGESGSHLYRLLKKSFTCFDMLSMNG